MDNDNNNITKHEIDSINKIILSWQLGISDNDFFPIKFTKIKEVIEADKIYTQHKKGARYSDNNRYWIR